ncbi:hypothetical protein CRG98_015151 [Punica granatum]|uniref:CASP-like protein n=1 Tax=Punica granatum TaxID=22663 RepID=A0A2I0K9K3_PUNGR|nr:hypothetical protein CRG98_015151 [Punica granatum]
MEFPDQFLSATSRTRLTMLDVILWVSFTVPLLLLQLPCESIDGSPVPTVIFKGLSSTFHGFLVSVTLAFTGAFSALVVDDGSQFTRACRYLSMASMASALLFLVWALVV